MMFRKPFVVFMINTDVCKTFLSGSQSWKWSSRLKGRTNSSSSLCLLVGARVFWRERRTPFLCIWSEEMLIEDFEKTSGCAENVEQFEHGTKDTGDFQCSELSSAYHLMAICALAKGRPQPHIQLCQVSKTSCKLLKHGNTWPYPSLLLVSMYWSSYDLLLKQS